MKRFLGIALCLIIIMLAGACAKADPEVYTSAENNDMRSAAVNEETELKIFIDGTEIPVIWEQNETVKELKADASNGPIEVDMSMYGGNEQVGSLGKTYTRNDRQITTHNGDIVLYSADQIVLFYGSNSWSYTVLGKIDLPEDQVTELLSNGNIELTIKN